MRLTRRGRAVVAIVAGAGVAAVLHGPRGLDAIIAPGVVALAVGLLQVARVDEPAVERRLPERGTREEEVTVGVEVMAEDTLGGRFHDAVGDGLEASGNDRLVTIAGEPIEYRLSLPERGEHTVGPLSIEVTDVLGLASVTHRYPDTDGILVRPRVEPISVPPSEVYPEYGDFGPEHGDFDYLREYQPGDPTKDVHWKSSAKTADDGLLVSEFSASEEGVDAITVAADATPDTDDDVADAAASLIVFLMDAGLEVGLRTPEEEIVPGTGIDHRNDLLDALATFGPGTLRDGRLADPALHVSGTEDGVSIETSGRTLRFADLLGEGDPGGAEREPPAPA
jgi:uncharacterized protein (DUF58 family)